MTAILYVSNSVLQTNLVEKYIEKELKGLFPEFAMDQFMKTLE